MQVRLSLLLALVATLAAGAAFIANSWVPAEVREHRRAVAELRARVDAQTWEREPLRGVAGAGDAWTLRDSVDILIRGHRSDEVPAKLFDMLSLAGQQPICGPTSGSAATNLRGIWHAYQERLPSRSSTLAIHDLIDALQLALDAVRCRSEVYGDYHGAEPHIGAYLLIEVLHELSLRIDRDDLGDARALLISALALADRDYPSRVPKLERELLREVADSTSFHPFNRVDAVRNGEAAVSIEDAERAVIQAGVLGGVGDILERLELWRHGLARIRDLRIQLRPELARALTDPVTGRRFDEPRPETRGSAPTLPFRVAMGNTHLILDSRHWRLAAISPGTTHIYTLGPHGARRTVRLHTLARVRGFDFITGRLETSAGDWDLDRVRLVRSPLDRESSQWLYERRTSDGRATVWRGSPNGRWGPAATLSDRVRIEGFQASAPVSIVDLRTRRATHTYYPPGVDWELCGVSNEGTRFWLQGDNGRSVILRDHATHLERRAIMQVNEAPAGVRFTDGDIELVTSTGRVLRLTGPDSMLAIDDDEVTQYLPPLDALVTSSGEVMRWPRE